MPTASQPQFLYFDLGNVVLKFSHQKACEQMAAVAGCTAADVRAAIFDSGLEHRYEAGEVTDEQFYEAFCTATGTRPDYDHLMEAGSDIFELNPGIVPLLGQLRAAGRRLGILSNTCGPHWNRVSKGRYGVLGTMFEVFALNYKMGKAKPDADIYRKAAAEAGVEPEKVFFCDDLPANVAAAKQAGFDAVLFTDVPTLAKDLRERGVRCNY